MDVPMVIFTEPKLQPFILDLRRHENTHIIVSEFANLHITRQFGQQIATVINSDSFKNGHEMLAFPEVFSPNYSILINSKVRLLKEAVDQNFFRTEYFYWIDLGYGHGEGSHFPTDSCWAPRNAMLDKISIVALNDVNLYQDIHQLYKKAVHPGVAAGFFGGSRAAVTKFYDRFSHIIEEFLSRNMIDSEQTLMLECYRREPELFNPVSGCFFDAFRLFNWSTSRSVFNGNIFIFNS